ncbi:MAG: pepsin/retropepsin-like aspartic protease family protein, partial [Verrucomicrobiota bacterium]|nr:pepsin/retropepsin-like aspartic protease family protein [Verrucomicrobiota bacterium]
LHAVAPCEPRRVNHQAASRRNAKKTTRSRPDAAVLSSAPVLDVLSFSLIRQKIAAFIAAALALSVPIATPSRAATAGALQYEALPLIRSAQNHLLVRAEINGKPALLGVDTGAPVSAIAINRRAYFGMAPITGKSTLPSRLSINGAFNSVAIARNLRLGALNLVDEPMVMVDLGGMRRSGKRDEIDGILGADILFPTKAMLDCQRQILVLKINPSVPGSVPGFDLSGFQRIPMYVSDGFNLYVDGSINGRKARLMVDTGAFATLLHSRFVRGMRIPLRETPFSSSGVNLKHRGVQMATISRFSIGSMDLDRKDVGVINLEGLIHGGLLDASPPVAGLLGSEILRRHHAIIDFGTKSLYLKR